MSDLDALIQPNGEGNVDTDVDVGFELMNDETAPDAATQQNGAQGSHGESLLSPQEVTKYRARWEMVQGGFIDDPNRAVEQADNLVDMVIKRLTDSFTYERDQLVRSWDQGAEPSTEDMRVALQGYRALLDRLYRL